MLKPYEYQQDDIDFLTPFDNGAIFHDAGVGKTMIAINVMRNKCMAHNKRLKTLIFCPIIVLENWKRELMACSKLEANDIGIVTGTPKARLKIIDNPKHSVLICNYEATRSADILSALYAWCPEITICDESHLIKTPKIKTPSGKLTQFGAVCKISQGSFYRYIMTGTPITKDAQDIWSQYYFLDRGETFGDRFYSFKKKYFLDLNRNMPSKVHFPNWTFIPSMEHDFKRLLASKSVRRKKESCVELPDLVEQLITVKMSPDQARVYADLKSKLIAYMEQAKNDPVVVQNALTKMLRLSEILSGYVKTEDGEIVKFKTNPRLDALMSLIETTSPHKVIVFCTFRENYKDIKHALEKRKIGYTEVHGGISTKDKLANVDTFNDISNDCRVMIANPKSGGVGINLKSARYAIYYTRSFSLVDFEQSKARNYRSGSIDHHDKITHYHLVTPDTVDEAALNSLRMKQNVASSLIDIKRILN